MDVQLFPILFNIDYPMFVKVYLFLSTLISTKSRLKNSVPTLKNLYSSYNALENLKHVPLEELKYYRLLYTHLTIYTVHSRFVGEPCLLPAGLLDKTSPS